jgi:hypothetical protein
MVETKAKGALEDVDFVQALSYLKASGHRIGLLFNFGGASGSRVAGGTASPGLRQEGISTAAVGGHWSWATQLGAFHLEGVVRIVDGETTPAGR